LWTEEGEIFTSGNGGAGSLGHGGEQDELVPRLIEALTGREGIGASAGDLSTAAWTEAGEAFTFGAGDNGILGHRGEENELMPRLVEALE